MYIDAVVVSGLVIVALVCVMGAVMGVYAYKHFQQDVADAKKSSAPK